MRLYSRHTWRAMQQNKAAYIGAVCIIALGVLVQVAMTDTLYNLRNKVALYFDDSHFADVFATVESLPAEELARLSETPGIDQAFGRLSGDVRLLLPEQNEIITIHLLAYSADDTLDRITLADDRMTINDGEIYLGNKMQAVYRFHAGDTLQLLVNGRNENFSFAGTANAPEYIYAMPPGSQTPDGAIYDIACLDKTQLEQLLGREGIVTELGFTLEPNYRFADVQTALAERLTPYGLSALTGQNDQISNYMLRSEFSQLTTMGIVLPAIFLAISIFMLYIVLKKLIDKDRSLIGTMKAFGMTDGELLVAYLKQSLAIGAAGAVLGSILAILMGKYMFTMYVDYFDLPYPYYDNYLSSRLVGFAIALLTSFIATLWGVKDILRIAPAEAMRPSAPVSTKMLPLPVVLLHRLNARQKMGLRAIWRNKGRSVIIGLAIAFPFALSSVLFSFDTIADQMFYSQFEKIQLYDLKATLASPTFYTDAINAASQLDGVYQIEAMGEFPLLARHQNFTKYVTLTVLVDDSALYHITDIYDHDYSPPDNGLIVNRKIADDLHLHIGDMLEVTNAQLSPSSITIPIVYIIDEALGTNCYLSQSGLTRYFATPPLANAVTFRLYPNALSTVKAQLADTANVIALTDSARTLKGYRELMQSMMAMVNVFALMAVFTGIILITNISTISIRERRSEFGTLSILGMAQREIGEIIAFEQIIYFFGGLLLSIPLIAIFRQIMESIVASDAYTVQVQIPLAAYIKALIICIVIMIVAFGQVMKNIKAIQPTDILKERA